MDQAADRQAPFNPLQYSVLRLVVGWSAHDAILRKMRRGCRPIDGLADLDFAIRNESVGRDGQVERRWTPANAARGIVLRTMAGAEKSVVVALMRDGNTTQMRADTDDNQPLVVPFLDAGLIGLRIGQARHINGARLFDLL